MAEDVWRVVQQLMHTEAYFELPASGAEPPFPFWTETAREIVIQE